ncbi:MAG: PEP-CTERM sorting domain-containing protein [Phycisphaerae bacterium]|nr:PEP-CTERM sorting domain-containing protein [Phycisphaerae bacterium]
MNSISWVTAVTTAGSTAFSLEVLPEPATMSLLALGGLGVLLRRKR